MSALDDSREAVTVVAVAGTGVMGAVFFAFSTFVMTGLRRLPAPHGLQAMNAINRAAGRSPGLMTALFGTAMAYLAIAALALCDLGTTSSTLRLVAALLYLVGVVGLTIGFHVPRNDALALIGPDAPGAAAAWRDYAAVWTAANHLRTVTSILACVMLTVAHRRA